MVTELILSMSIPGHSTTATSAYSDVQSGTEIATIAHLADVPPPMPMHPKTFRSDHASNWKSG